MNKFTALRYYKALGSAKAQVVPEVPATKEADEEAEQKVEEGKKKFLQVLGCLCFVISLNVKVFCALSTPSASGFHVEPSVGMAPKQTNRNALYRIRQRKAEKEVKKKADAEARKQAQAESEAKKKADAEKKDKGKSIASVDPRAGANKRPIEGSITQSDPKLKRI